MKVNFKFMNKVLIVDDAAFMRLAIRKMLERNGFEIVGEAENGNAAISKYAECQPDVVTMDITMPDMSGIEALREIRKLDPNARVIMVSAMGQELMVKEAIASGAKSFVVKPYKEEHFIKTINKILAM